MTPARQTDIHTSIHPDKQQTDGQTYGHYDLPCQLGERGHPAIGKHLPINGRARPASAPPCHKQLNSARQTCTQHVCPPSGRARPVVVKVPPKIGKPPRVPLHVRGTHHTTSWHEQRSPPSPMGLSQRQTDRHAPYGPERKRERENRPTDNDRQTNKTKGQRTPPTPGLGTVNELYGNELHCSAGQRPAGVGREQQ